MLLLLDNWNWDEHEAAEKSFQRHITDAILQDVNSHDHTKYEIKDLIGPLLFFTTR